MKTQWNRWIVALVFVVAKGVNGDTITREYVETKVCGDHLSYETCRESLLLQLRRRFAEEVVGAYVESHSQSSLEGRDESVQQRIRSMTMARATLKIKNDNMHQEFYESGGVLTIHAKMSIDEPAVFRFQRKLDQETQVAALPEITRSSPIPRSFRFPSPRRERVAIYMDVGVTESISSGEKVGLIGALGIEYIDPPLSLDLLFLGVGDGAVAEGKPGTTVEGGNLVFKLLPVNARFFRLGIGGGVGIVHLREITEEKEYDTYGGQALGLVEMTFFPGRLRLRIRGIYKETRFPSDKDIPVLDRESQIGSGFFYTLGFLLEL